MQALKKLITKLLRETADKIDSENCELSESEAMDIMSVLSHQVMSKEDACKEAMLEAYEVENKGEAPAYTIAHLVERMWKVFSTVVN